MRRYQRGFIYLTTGANGAGKTLLTLKHVKELADKSSRPVCYNGRFDLAPDGPLKNWKKIDIKDWQAEPDGTIFLVDECHNDFPKRGTSEATPEYVRMLAEHRKRGFDFFLITQHPMNLDAFVRRLIGDPGWHRHLKRTFGAELVSQLQWSAVNASPEKPGSGSSGVVAMVPYPKEVYSWYKSAMIHTGKKSIPRQVWVLGAVALLIPLLGYFAVTSLTDANKKRAEVVAASVGAKPGAAAPASGRAAPAAAGPLTTAEYVAVREARLQGLPHTAPAFDAITAPVHAPYPAACIDGTRPATKQKTCECFTQQGTRLPTPVEICRQIALNGFFIEWAMTAEAGSQQAAGAADRSAFTSRETPSVNPSPARVVSPVPSASLL